MISNDQVHAGNARSFSGSKGANACINADHQAHAFGCGTLDDFITHAVTFTNAMRNVELGGATTHLDCGLQHYSRSGAVHVVVPVDQHAFATLDGSTQALNRLTHAAH